MAINRGKQFEDNLKKQFEKLKDVCVTRLYDVTMGYSNINNPCDYIVYKCPTINYFECKAIKGKYLNFKSHIRQNQWDKLLEYSKISGTNAGVIAWFIDYDITLFIDINYLDLLKSNNYKSFNITKDIEIIPTVEIKGKKKKVFFDYNLEKFLEDISYE